MNVEINNFEHKFAILNPELQQRKLQMANNKSLGNLNLNFPLITSNSPAKNIHNNPKFDIYTQFKETASKMNNLNNKNGSLNGIKNSVNSINFNGDIKGKIKKLLNNSDSECKREINLLQKNNKTRNFNLPTKTNMVSNISNNLINSIEKKQRPSSSKTKLSLNLKKISLNNSFSSMSMNMEGEKTILTPNFREKEKKMFIPPKIPKLKINNKINAFGSSAHDLNSSLSGKTQTPNTNINTNNSTNSSNIIQNSNNKNKNLEFTFKSTIMKEEIKKIKQKMGSEEDILNTQESNSHIHNYEFGKNKIIVNGENIKSKIYNFKNIKEMKKLNIKIIKKNQLIKNTLLINPIIKPEKQLLDRFEEIQKLNQKINNLDSMDFLDTLQSIDKELDKEQLIIATPKDAFHVIKPIVKYKTDNNIEETIEVKRKADTKISRPPKMLLSSEKMPSRKQTQSLTISPKFLKVSQIDIKNENKNFNYENSTNYESNRVESVGSRNSNNVSIDSRRKSTPKILKNHPHISKFFG